MSNATDRIARIAVSLWNEKSGRDSCHGVPTDHQELASALRELGYRVKVTGFYDVKMSVSKGKRQ